MSNVKDKGRGLRAATEKRNHIQETSISLSTDFSTETVGQKSGKGKTTIKNALPVQSIIQILKWD